MNVGLKIFLIALLASAGCNRGRLGGREDDSAPSTGVSIKIKKISNASQTVKGKGQLRVSAAYPLLLSCTNCVALGVNLPFVDAPMEMNKYVYTADFDYSLGIQTEVCALTISASSKDGTAIKAVKTYNVYVCPRQGADDVCDTDKAAPSCAHIGR